VVGPSTPRRALVTGGAGFIGSHVVDAFRARHYETLVIDNLSSGKRENLSGDLVELDIRDADGVSRAAREFAPTAVAHLAAQASVTYAVRHPDEDLLTNVLGTLNVLEAARKAGAPVVFASTGGALYGDDVPFPTPEDAQTRPLSPYGASKLAAEAYVGTWMRLHGIANVVLRLGNVYGPRQAPHGEAGVVAIFSERLATGLAVTVFGDGEQTRDYIHVGDVADAFVLAAESGRPGTFNVGTGVETSVNELLRLLQDIAATSVDPTHEPLRAGELRRSALDARRITDELGWPAPRPVARGLGETFRAYAASA